jgi:hypothetical protein
MSNVSGEKRITDLSWLLQAEDTVHFSGPQIEEISNLSFAMEDEDVPKFSLPLQDMLKSEACTTAVGIEPEDKQSSKAKVKRDPKIAMLMEEPANSPTEAVAVARRLLNNGDIPAAMEVIRFWFCRKSRSPHMMRMIHFNPKNWVIIPYLPRRYREVANDTVFGERLRARLQSNEQWEEYLMYCGLDHRPKGASDDQMA